MEPKTSSTADVRISVVIPTHRRPGSVRLALLSVLDQDIDPGHYEVIVVDNSPTDEIVRIVEELRPHVRCLLSCYTTISDGPGPKRNLGVQHARGSIIALMDSDCVAAPDWLRLGVAPLADERVGLVAGRTLPDPATPTGVFTRYVIVERETHIYESCNLFYRRTAYEAAGGFLPEFTFPIGGEDLDLAWRVKRLGWETRFCPEALVYHEVQPLSVWQWVYIQRLIIWPRLTRKFPELRAFYWRRYFFDKAQGLFVLGLVGLALSWLTPWSLALWLPYFVFRASEPSNTLRGALRLLRPLLYLSRDGVSFLVLAAGSIRDRCLLL